MKQDSIPRFRCPSCHSSVLRLSENGCNNTNGAIAEGALQCVSCQNVYPITGGIARFVPAENYAGSFGFQWNMHCRTQLDSHTGLDISRKRLFAVSGWPEQMQGQRILEAGSGAGRFTEVLLSTGADVYSFDYSVAVEANWKNNGSAPNLSLFQGDIFHIPFADRSFDKVLCLGVIQHTPDPERSFFSLASKVKPGGQLVIDVYAKSIPSLLRWKYILRPVTKRMDKQRLYRYVEKAVDVLLPLSIQLRRIGRGAGARLLPIVEYSSLGLSDELNRQWAILDTFDMYSPLFDHPQSLSTVRDWFSRAGFEQVDVRRGPNGVIGTGVCPVSRAV